jgi:hypothetical protein
MADAVRHDDDDFADTIRNEYVCNDWLLHCDAF